jgi:prefoldin subunit 5
MTTIDALRQEVEAARKQLKAAKTAGKRDDVLALAGYIGGLQVAMKVVNDAAKVAELAY